MAMNYATLVADKNTLGSIANWVNFSNAKIPVESILDEAQKFIFDNMRVTDMKEIQTLAVPAGAVSVATPARLLSILNLQNQYNLPLKSRDLKSVQDRRGLDSSGNPFRGDAPMFYALTKSTIEFEIAPASPINMTLTGYFAPKLLGDGTNDTVQTNFLTEKYPHLLRPAVLAFVADYLNDDAKYQRYLGRYQALLAQSMQSEEMNQFGMQVDMDYSESRI